MRGRDPAPCKAWEDIFERGVYATDMGAAETKLEMLRRHCREGEGHVARQRALVARLVADGLPTKEARELLVTFEDLQRQHEAHLARAEAEASRPSEQAVAAEPRTCATLRPEA